MMDKNCGWEGWGLHSCLSSDLGATRRGGLNDKTEGACVPDTFVSYPTIPSAPLLDLLPVLFFV